MFVFDTGYDLVQLQQALEGRCAQILIRLRAAESTSGGEAGYLVLFSCSVLDLHLRRVVQLRPVRPRIRMPRYGSEDLVKERTNYTLDWGLGILNPYVSSMG